MEDDLIWLKKAKMHLFAASKFDEFFKQKFNKHSELLSCTIFLNRLRYTLIILQDWIVTIIPDFSVTFWRLSRIETEKT